MVLSAVTVGFSGLRIEAQAQTPAAGETTTVIACSDYQYPNTDYYGVSATGNAGGAIVVGRIAAQMQNAGISDVDGFLCAGDYDYDLNRRGNDTRAGVDSLTSAATTGGLIGSGTTFVNVQGNHDPKNTP